MSGTLIRKLNTEVGIGKQAVIWNGPDNNGNAEFNSYYLVKIQIVNEYMTKRFIFSR